MVTLERAIEILKVESSYVAEINIDAIITYKMAIESLEKQIPKKPVETDYEGYICPVCQEGQLIQPEVVDSDYQISYYCNVCGQKIDWD